MTRQELSAWWAKRGDAWGSIQAAETALLEARLVGLDDVLRRRVQDALGCLAGAREILALATERAHVLADGLPKSGTEET